MRKMLLALGVTILVVAGCTEAQDSNVAPATASTPAPEAPAVSIAPAPQPAAPAPTTQPSVSDQPVTVPQVAATTPPPATAPSEPAPTTKPALSRKARARAAAAAAAPTTQKAPTTVPWDTAIQPPEQSAEPFDASKTIVVAADGSGQFKQVQSAINFIPAGTKDPVTIHIKPGTYKERIVIPFSEPPIRIYGDDPATTILTYNLHANMIGENGAKIGTFLTPTVSAYSNDFEADDITFENSTPRDTSQALALSALGDRQVYRRCHFLGWQDTLYTNTAKGNRSVGYFSSSRPDANIPSAIVSRMYFEDCYIEGGVDFIFGNSTAVFRFCEVHSKRRGYLTAGSTLKDWPFGYVFMFCNLTAAPDLPYGSVYLGRPWRGFASVVYMNCLEGSQINPAGWLNWKGTDFLNTARYSEFNCFGPGAATAKRVPWSHQLTEDQAKAISIDSVLGGDDHWNPHPRN